MKTALEINFFLHLGYFPGYEQTYPLDYSRVDKGLYAGWDKPALIEAGAGLFREAIAQNFTSGQKQMVPISGGLDSRAILAALREYTSVDNIEAYTFGTPGSYDFEIGAQIAQAAGVQHRAIDLSKVSWHHEELLQNAQMNDCQTFLFHHVPASLLEPLKGRVIWSGYVGDVVCGGHRYASPAIDVDQAKRCYLKKRAEVKSTNLLSMPLTALEPYINRADLAPETLSYDEQVTLNELGCVTAPHLLVKGYEYRTPFINNGFFDFILSVDHQWRYQRKLFIEIMQHAYPDLFALPTKANYGLPLQAASWQVGLRRAKNKIHHLALETVPQINWPPSPNINFMNFAELVRSRPDLKAITGEALQSLKGRGIVDWIDIDRLWQVHQNRRANHADALLILTSLELNLQALEAQKLREAP